MVKSYLRYVPSSTLGVVASANSNILCAHPPSSNHTSRTQPTFAIAPALESIKIWNVKTSMLQATLHDPPSTAEVTALVQNPVRKNIIAAGYEDGSVRVWNMNEDWNNGELAVTFNGHKSAVNILCFDTQGNRLASGSRDTDVVLWDIVSEEGIARLRSHQDQITGLSFLSPSNSSNDEEDQKGDFLLSAGKDGLIKVWDLSTNFCVETHLAHRGEIWALAVSPAQDVIVTAGPDGELKFWTVIMIAISETDYEAPKMLSQRGTITRANKDKPLSLKFHSSAGIIAVHASNRNVEIFRIRTAEEIKKSLSRKRKRKSTKKDAKNEDEHDESSELDITSQVVAYSTIRATSKVRSLDWDSLSNTTAVQVFPMLIYILMLASVITRLKCNHTLQPAFTPSKNQTTLRTRTHNYLIHPAPRSPFRNPYPRNLIRRRNAPLSRSRRCKSVEHSYRQRHPKLGLRIRFMQCISPR